MPEVDPYEDMDVEGLIDFGDYVPPQQDKQLVPKPPTYEESLQDLMEGMKEIYVDPQYFPQELDDLPPAYDEIDYALEDKDIDYALDDEDTSNEILNDVGIVNYENADKILNQSTMTLQKTKKYLNKIIKEAKSKRGQLSGYKANVTKQYNKGRYHQVKGKCETEE